MDSLINSRDVADDTPLSPELEAQIDGAYEAARSAPPAPAVYQVEYLAGVRLLLLHLKSGQRLVIPIEELEDLAGIPEEKLSHTELLASGTWIHFPEFDGNLDVPSLVAGTRGSKKWMEQLEAKRSAALKAAA
jgi:hypothetical protein